MNAATWYWTGNGGDLNWFTPANWNTAADGSGDAATELASGDSFTFGSAIDSATAINYNPSVDDFAIDTITFASGCGAVTVSGADVNKVTQIVNESEEVQTFANDVYFDLTLNVRTSASATTGDPKVLFTGEKGAFGTKFANHNYYRGKNTVDAWTLTDTPTYPVIVDGAIVTVKGKLQYNAEGIMGAASTVKYRISIGHGAKLTVNGLAFYWTQYGAGTDNSLVLFSKNNGIAIFRGGLQAKCSASTKDGYAYIDCYEGRSGSTGIVATTSLEFNAAQKGANGHRFHITVPEIVMLPGYQNKVTTSYGRMAYPGSLTWKVAEGDVTFNGYYSTKTDHSSFYICPFTFNTTDAFDGTTPRTITVSGKITGVTAAAVTRAVALSAAGCGTNAYTCAFDNFTGGFTAKDTVTVSIDASDARPGSGAVIMQTGTTLAVGKSVTSGSFGNLTLQSGTSLAFNFTSTATAPVLALGGTLTLPSAGQDPVTVKVSANEGISFRSVGLPEKYQLSTNGKFTGTAVTSGQVVLADDAPFWVRGIGIENGNLYVYTRAPGLSLSVR